MYVIQMDKTSAHFGIECVKSKEDVEWYLVNALEKCNDPSVYVHDGRTYSQFFGFRRAFSIHGVFRSDDGKKYGFHVSDDGWDGQNAPNLGLYDSYAELLQGVAIKYSKRWKLC